MVAAAVIGGGVLSAGSNLIGSQTAASGQKQAANTNLAAQQSANATSLAEQANAQQTAGQYLGYAQDIADKYYGRGTQSLEDQFGTAQSLLQPFVNTGIGTMNNLVSEISSGNLGAMPSLTDPTQLPGYSFTLDQGLKATQNAAAAQGLGISGAAMKGATNYAEGLAGTYYNNYLSNYWANQNNRYNMLAGLVNTGATAAGNLAQYATNTGANLASLAGGVGNQLVATTGGLGGGSASAATQAGSQVASTTTGTAANIGQAQAAGAATQAAGLSSAGNSLTSVLNNPAVLSALSGNTLFGGSTITGPAANASIAAGGPPLAPNISASNLNQLLGYQ